VPSPVNINCRWSKKCRKNRPPEKAKERLRKRGSTRNYKNQDLEANKKNKIGTERVGITKNGAVWKGCRKFSKEG